MNMVKNLLKFAFCVSLIVGAFVTTAIALAQEKSPAQDSSASKKSQFNVEQRKKDVKIFLDKIEILGRVEKPQTVFIIQGKDPTVDDIQIDRSFFKEIFRPIEKDEMRKIAAKSKRTFGTRKDTESINRN